MTDITLTDPFSEWSLLKDDGSVILVFTDGTNQYRLRFTQLIALGQLAMSITDAAKTRSIYDEHGFDMALEYVTEVLNGPEYSESDETLSVDDLNRLQENDDGKE